VVTVSAAMRRRQETPQESGMKQLCMLHTEWEWKNGVLARQGMARRSDNGDGEARMGGVRLAGGMWRI